MANTDLELDEPGAPLIFPEVEPSDRPDDYMFSWVDRTYHGYVSQPSYQPGVGLI